ncbi:MAG: outer membrane lipoprotein-sorting protein [Terrimicrobiaceae bacterium]
MKCRPFVFCLFLVAVSARADTEAEAILKATRTNPLGQPVVLNAQLRANGQKVPFQIAVRDGKISYLFENPPQEILLGLGEAGATLEERKGGKTQPVAPARYDDSVRGGLLTYEDLAMRFLYWKNPKLLGEENIGPSTAYKIEIPAPPAATEYGVVRVWVDKNSGALMQIEGYDRGGRLSKKFTVVSGQQIDGRWMLKQMRVERMDPETGKAVLRTYLEILGKADAASAISGRPAAGK